MGRHSASRLEDDTTVQLFVRQSEPRWRGAHKRKWTVIKPRGSMATLRIKSILYDTGLVLVFLGIILAATGFILWTIDQAMAQPAGCVLDVQLGLMTTETP